MTLLKKYGKCLADLILELRAVEKQYSPQDLFWVMRLEGKIVDMQKAIRALVQDKGYE